ncbi:YgaP family membrane protein [Granulosicoccus sp. 3-233]|uniref:YgaP family membrane protein n=1 Tax=Granulosicoccus sp. 3-233 TaxID=3417969 RepID=UPI003D327BD9
MKSNIGSLDRRLRIVAGIVLVLMPLLVGFDSGLARALSILVGVVLLVTAALNSCPIYRLLGFSSRTR